MDLMKLNNEAKSLQESLENIRTYVEAVNKNLAGMHDDLDKVISDKKLEEYIKNVEKACQHTGEIYSIVTEGRSVCQDSVKELQKSISSLAKSKNDLTELIEHGYEFIHRVEALHDIQEIIKSFDTLKADLDNVYSISDKLLQARQEADRLVAAADIISRKTDIMAESVTDLHSINNQLEKIWDNFEAEHIKLAEQFSLQKNKMEKYQQQIGQIQRMVEGIDAVAEKFQQGISGIADYQVKFQKAVVALQSVQEKTAEAFAAGNQQMCEAADKITAAISENIPRLQQELQSIAEVQNKLIEEKFNAMTQQQAELREMLIKSEKRNKIAWGVSAVVVIILLGFGAWYGIQQHNLVNNAGINTTVEVNDDKPTVKGLSNNTELKIGTIGELQLRETSINEAIKKYNQPAMVKHNVNECAIWGGNDYGAPFEVYYDKDTGIIIGIIVRNGYQLSTSKGIKCGDSRQKLEAAYGEPQTSTMEGPLNKVQYENDGELLEVWLNASDVIVTIHSQII